MSVDVTIIVPVKDVADCYIGQCIESLKDQDFEGCFEIIVVGGGNRAQARNLGIEVSKGDIVAFIDSDCVAPFGWLSSLENELKMNSKLGGVGGVNIPPPNSGPFERAVGYVLLTYFGSLGSPSLYKPKKPKYVDKLACINSGFWKKVLTGVGGFDGEFEFNEDTNLSYKIKDKGWNLLFDPKIVVWHHRRESLKKFAKQFFDYGFGRMRSAITDRRYADPSIFAFFFGALSFPLIALLLPIISVISVAFYLIVSSFFAFKIAWRAKEVVFLFLVPLLLMVEHLSYFFGMVLGITKGKWKKKRASCKILQHLIISKGKKFE